MTKIVVLTLIWVGFLEVCFAVEGQGKFTSPV